MPDYFSTSLGAISNANLSLSGYNGGSADPKVYLKAKNDSGFVVKPGETIRALVAPQSSSITDLIASGMLADAYSTDVSESGYFFSKTFVNEKNKQITAYELPVITVTRSYENTLFDLYWLQTLESQVIFDSNTAGVYTWPHNIQPEEITVSGELINDNTRMRYTVIWSEIANADSAAYTTENPYLLNIRYENDNLSTVTGYMDGNPIEFQANTWSGYAAGSASGGLTFDLAYYDERPVDNVAPASYIISINNKCPLPDVTGAIPFEIPVNHQVFDKNQLVDLDTYVSSSVDPGKMNRVDDLLIDPRTIDRRRLSIGIQDIAIRENSYKKKGIFVSNAYVTDFPLYIFYMKVKEYIPSYGGLNPYDLVKYFIEFNGKPWQQISPINRSREVDSDGKSIPRMLVFDKDTGTTLEGTKFLDYEAPVISFRVKITFDLSQVEESNFVPPEIKDYDCIVFDKNQLLEL